jgi:preprotein translocase subunit SecA
MRIFGSDRISGLMERLGMTEGQEIENRMVTKAIENAQKRVEGHNFDIRKHLLEYDDVMNMQREAVYGQRRGILGADDLSEEIEEMIRETVQDLVQVHIDPRAHREEWDLDGLADHFFTIFGFRPGPVPGGEGEGGVEDALTESAMEVYRGRESEFGSETLRKLEKILYLQILDSQWKDHLYGMDQLREGIGLRGYGQRDPLSEYKIEGFGMFEEMMGRVREDTVRTLFLVQLAEEENLPKRRQQNFSLTRGAMENGRPQGAEPPRRQTVRRETPKVGRNQPCPCGSGKKYKKCCGAS